MQTRKLPEQAQRVESGPTRFGDDWTGVFIRGDNAMFYAFQLRQVIESGQLPNFSMLPGLLRLLESCQEVQ